MRLLRPKPFGSRWLTTAALLTVGAWIAPSIAPSTAYGQDSPLIAQRTPPDSCADVPLDQSAGTYTVPPELGDQIPCDELPKVHRPADEESNNRQSDVEEVATAPAEVIEPSDLEAGVNSTSAQLAATPTRGGVISVAVSTPIRPAWQQAASAPPSSRLPVAQVTVPAAPRRSPTPTHEPTETPSPSETPTPTPTDTPSPTPSPTASLTPTPTVTSTFTTTPTTTATVEATPTATPSDVPRLTPTTTSFPTPTATAAVLATPERRSRVFANDSAPPISPGEPGTAGLAWVGRGSGPPAVPHDAPAPAWWLSPDAPTAWEVREDPRIGLMARNMASTFEAMRKCFAGVSGHVCGFRPGNAYDAIYVRDSAYLSAVTRYAYTPMHLRSVVEEVLAIQYDEGDDELPIRDKLPRIPWPSRPGDGAISAVIDYDLRREKASVASDEEQSLIRAAYVAYRVDGGTTWLRKQIRGRSVLDRLALAMAWTLEHRRDEATGLVIRPHTTDWGDVESGDDGSWGGDAPPTAWTASIYDQAVTYRALRELAIMCVASGDSGRARMFTTLADDLRARTRDYLWSDARGYFRTHVHVQGAPPGMRPIRAPLVHSFEEDEIVSVANAIAIYAGLADDGQTARATEALEGARINARSAIPGVALYPAYPGGTFRSPQMAPGRYQNGAAWDWWAGTQIVAEFARGYSNQAYIHLAAMAKAWSDNPDDIPEWRAVDPDAPVGVGRPSGSGHYAAAAGTMGEAVLFGLFGLELSHDTWSVTPRLGSLSGQARIRTPLDNGESYFLTVGQRVSREGGSLLVAVTYVTNHPQQGWLAIRVPSDQPPSSVRVDGQELGTQWTLSTAGSDTLVTIGAADSGKHDIEIEWRGRSAP